MVSTTLKNALRSFSWEESVAVLTECKYPLLNVNDPYRRVERQNQNKPL